MALPTITVDDFVGWLKIVANQFKEEDLDQYIITFREQYLRQLVGAAAYADIEAQTRQKWTDLLDGVNYVDVDDKRRYYEGLVKPLIRFIYFEFVRDNFTATQVGRVKGKSENSERANDIEVANTARARFNNGVMLLASTPDFLEANEEFEEGVTASTDNLDNTYTLSIPNTKYLEAGDTVTIDGQEYQPISVTVDTSIVIDAGQTGLDFTGDLVTWKPYEDVEFCQLETAPI